MTRDGDLKEYIRLANTSAAIELPYNGTVTCGMLACLDETSLRKWWKLSAIKIEPEPGGIFYVQWPATSKGAHVIYGVMESIDTETNAFSVNKMIFVHNEEKITGLELAVSFLIVSASQSLICVKVNHQFEEYTKLVFDKAVMQLWPVTFRKFKKFVEK